MILTYRYRLKDSTHRRHLARMAWSVNRVWNFCNEVSMLAWKRDRRWLSYHDLRVLTKGTSHDLGLSSQAIQSVCMEYAIRRRQFRTHRLAWRSHKRSLGWIPFPNQAIRIQGDAVRC